MLLCIYIIIMLLCMYKCYSVYIYVTLYVYTVSVIKKLKYRTAPIQTFSELRAYFEHTTNRAVHAQFKIITINCECMQYGEQKNEEQKLDEK